MTRRIEFTLPEDEYAWLVKNWSSLSLGGIREPFVWQRARMRFVGALMQARTNAEVEAASQAAMDDYDLSMGGL